MLKDAGSAWANVRICVVVLFISIGHHLWSFSFRIMVVLFSFITIYFIIQHWYSFPGSSRQVPRDALMRSRRRNPVDFILFHPISRQDGFLAKCLYQLSFHIKYLIISFYINFSTTWSESSGRMNWRSKLATRPNGVSGRSTTHSEPKKRDQITAIGVLDPEIVSGLKPMYVYNNSNNNDTNWIIMIIIMYYDHNSKYIYIMIIIEE